MCASTAAVVIDNSPPRAAAPILVHDGGVLIEARQKKPVRTPNGVRAFYVNSSPRCDQRALFSGLQLKQNVNTPSLY